MNHCLQLLSDNDPDVYRAISGEQVRQQKAVNLIPSENYTYPEVLAALGSVLTKKYSERYPGHRYYGGQTHTDQVEELARQRACALFRAEHANVQPLSGSPMNQAVYFAFLKPGGTILAMDLSHGGHLTHGAPVSHMGRIFNFVRYRTQTGRQGAIDFDELLRLAKESRPKIVLCGYTSCPREYDYAAFRAVASEVGALAKAIDASVFPGLQGGPHMNSIAATLLDQGVTLVTGGTDNHMLVVDTVTGFGMDGRQAEQVLDGAGITTDKQVIPDDLRPPLRPSGIRAGTPACTTRGMAEAEMARIAGWMVEALRGRQEDARVARISGQVQAMCAAFPLEIPPA